MCENTIFGPQFVIYETEILGHIERTRSLVSADGGACVPFFLFVLSSGGRFYPVGEHAYEACGMGRIYCMGYHNAFVHVHVGDNDSVFDGKIQGGCHS